MENLPPNSHASKKATEPDPPREKKIERVTTNEVTRGKKPLSRRFLETFIGGDSKSVFSYVLMEVLVPAARDMIADAFSQGVERMIYGEARSVSRRTGMRASGGNGFVSYNRMSSPTVRPAQSPFRHDPRPEPNVTPGYDWESIVFATRAEGEEVIRRMFDVLNEYRAISVYDLYELVGITGKHTDYKWGWTDIRGVGLIWIKSGYLLDLPKPSHLD